MNTDKHNFYSKEDEQFLIDNYLKLTTEEMSKILKRSESSILSKGSRFKLKKHNKVINHNYFDNWSYDMAYILGLTMADGCIPTKGHQIVYSFSGKDFELLKYISLEIMNADYSKQRLQKNYKTVYLPITTLKISSQKIRDSLANYHIVPRKTGREKLCDIPNEYKSSYLLGLFDGDGCVTFIHPNSKKNPNKRYTRIEIVSGNKQFLEDVKNNLGFGLGNVNKKDGIFAWTICSQKDVKFIADFMYSGKNKFCLQRKKERFNEIRNIRE